MVTIVIKDAYYGDVEITRLTFASREEAEAKKHEVFEEFFAIYGSGSCGFYGTYLDETEEVECKCGIRKSTCDYHKDSA